MDRQLEGRVKLENSFPLKVEDLYLKACLTSGRDVLVKRVRLKIESQLGRFLRKFKDVSSEALEAALRLLCGKKGGESVGSCT